MKTGTIQIAKAQISTEWWEGKLCSLPKLGCLSLWPHSLMLLYFPLLIQTETSTLAR